MKLGIFVGSFNPIHNGHIKVMDFLINNNYVDRIIIVATTSYWDKKIDVSLNDRINMIKCINKDYLIVEDKLNNIEYTYMLLNALSKKFKGDELYLIMAADNIVNFDKWKNYQEILNYKVIILNRDNIDIHNYTDKYNSSNFIVIQDFEYIDISSTKLRSNLDNNYLDNKVLKYIKDNKLYQ